MDTIMNHRWTESTTVRIVDDMDERLTLLDLDRLAHGIDRDGIVAHERDAEMLAGRARALDIAPVAVDVLLDHDEKTVVRERAFLRVTMALSRTGRREPALVG